MCRDGRKGVAVKRETSGWVKQDPTPFYNETIVTYFQKSLFSSKHLILKHVSYTNEYKNITVL